MVESLVGFVPFCPLRHRQPTRCSFHKRCLWPRPASKCRRFQSESVTASLITHVSAVFPAIVLSSIAIVSTFPQLPAPLQNAPISFLLSAILANTTVLPVDSPVYPAIMALAPHAVALLLLSPAQVSVDRPTSGGGEEAATVATVAPVTALLPSFLVGSLGTILGAVVTCVVGAKWRGGAAMLPALCAALAATYIGGSVNFIAVAHALRLSTEVCAAAMAADLFAMAVYMAGLFALAARHSNRHAVSLATAGATARPLHRITVFGALRRGVLPLAVASGLVVLSDTVVRVLGLPPTVSLLLSSILAVATARVPVVKRWLGGASAASTLLLNMFFAGLGATARLDAMAAASPMILAAAVAILFVHGLLLFVVGRRGLRLSVPNLLVASNANVGGATTAPAFAAACGWPALIPSAVAVGTLGYAVATPAALMIHRFLCYLVSAM